MTILTSVKSLDCNIGSSASSWILCCCDMHTLWCRIIASLTIVTSIWQREKKYVLCVTCWSCNTTGWNILEVIVWIDSTAATIFDDPVETGHGRLVLRCCCCTLQQRGYFTHSFFLLHFKHITLNIIAFVLKHEYKHCFYRNLYGCLSSLYHPGGVNNQKVSAFILKLKKKRSVYVHLT